MGQMSRDQRELAFGLYAEALAETLGLFIFVCREGLVKLDLKLKGSDPFLGQMSRDQRELTFGLYAEALAETLGLFIFVCRRLKGSDPFMG